MIRLPFFRFTVFRTDEGILSPVKNRMSSLSLSSRRRINRGGYRPTARNRYYLRRYRQGKSIGFTLRSSLKAKGLLPRANGTKRVSAKYKRL